MPNSKSFKIGSKSVGSQYPVYFIADISANHDGDLERAKSLIHQAAEAGADAAKFQNFDAPKIVSDHGFKSLGGSQSHQSKWKRSVFEVYKQASLPWEWTPILKAECDKASIHYFSTPYDMPAVDMLDPYVPAYKIGSGDLSWPEICERIASKGKPVILATGASTIGEVQRAVGRLLNVNSNVGLMQCNTNYTGSLENFKHIHLNVLRTYELLFPTTVLGLSDHTPGHATVLGAVSLGARLIEKHFTDDTNREGPDHGFSMTPSSWREMVQRTRELEAALGTTVKEVADNEKETLIIQRRCLRAASELLAGTLISREMLDILRPAPPTAITPEEVDRVVGCVLRRNLRAGEALEWRDLAKKGDNG